MWLWKKLLAEVVKALPASFRETLWTNSTEQQSSEGLEFPSLSVGAAVEDQKEDSATLLSFTTRELNNFAEATNKALYSVSACLVCHSQGGLGCLWLAPPPGAAGGPFINCPLRNVQQCVIPPTPASDVHHTVEDNI